MYGMLKENGPFLVDVKAPPNDEPYLESNPYSWHKAANLLYVDNPVGTGFSHLIGEPVHSSMSLLAALSSCFQMDPLNPD